MSGITEGEKQMRRGGPGRGWTLLHSWLLGETVPSTVWLPVCHLMKCSRGINVISQGQHAV